jgi:hypothetical protein
MLKELKMNRIYLLMALLVVTSGVQAGELAARDRNTFFFDPLVQFTNVTVAARDAKTATVRFDVLWEDSWRNAINHDAAWVFFKVRANSGSEWQHARLAADRVRNPAGYGQAAIAPIAAAAGNALLHFQGRAADERIGGIESSPDTFTRAPAADTQIEFLVPAGSDGCTGVFLRRATTGVGVLTAHGVTVVVDLASLKGVTDITQAQIRPFGLLMVYVAEGPFYLGTGGTEEKAFYAVEETGTKTPPYRVAGAGAIPTGRKAGQLWARGDAPEDGGEIPASFPNGYNAFYCMKKHITNRNWAEFLEILTPQQSDARYYEKCNRVVRGGKTPNYTYKWSSGGARDGSGMRCLSWEDGVSFAAWAGLRPLTELEFEKVVRGPRLPVPEEVGPSYWNVGSIGCWPWDAIKNWETHCERAVTVGNAQGRAFKGTHGGGTLTLPADWPQADAVGGGFRYKPFPGLAGTFVSDRSDAARAAVDRENDYKFRCARTAPRDD